MTSRLLPTSAGLRLSYLLRFGLTAAFVPAAYACGGSHAPGDGVSASIGASGGALVGPGGAELVLPPGAVDQTTRFTLATLPTATAPLGTALVATPIHIDPKNLTLAVAATVTMPVTSLPAGYALTDVVVLQGDADLGTFTPLPTRPLGSAAVADTTNLGDFLAVVYDRPDAGASDAGATDAGATDAGATDAGVSDTGTPSDASVADAALLDGATAGDGAVAPECAADYAPTVNPDDPAVRSAITAAPALGTTAVSDGVCNDGVDLYWFRADASGTVSIQVTGVGGADVDVSVIYVSESPSIFGGSAAGIQRAATAGAVESTSMAVVNGGLYFVGIYAATPGPLAAYQIQRSAVVPEPLCADDAPVGSTLSQLVARANATAPLPLGTPTTGGTCWLGTDARRVDFPAGDFYDISITGTPGLASTMLYDGTGTQLLSSVPTSSGPDFITWTRQLIPMSSALFLAPIANYDSFFGVSTEAPLFRWSIQITPSPGCAEDAHEPDALSNNPLLAVGTNSGCARDADYYCYTVPTGGDGAYSVSITDASSATTFAQDGLSLGVTSGFTAALQATTVGTSSTNGNTETVSFAGVAGTTYCAVIVGHGTSLPAGVFAASGEPYSITFTTP